MGGAILITALVLGSVGVGAGAPAPPGTGPFVSANITPDASGNPTGLTLAQFQSVLRTGHDPEHPDEILQVMPWPILGDMTDHDIQAVYEYLRSIPPAEPGSCTGPGQAAP